MPDIDQTTLYALSVVAAVIVLLAGWKASVHRLGTHERQLAKMVADTTEELRKANQELQHLANSDPLTAIGNRRQFNEFLAGEWRRAIRFKTEVSLILIDIDHFRLFNDTYGHHAGDECLTAIADVLGTTIRRPTDLLTRFGDDEFAIVLVGTDEAGTLNIAQQAMTVVNVLAIPHRTSPTNPLVTISIGVATMFVSLGMAETELIKAADQARYRAKADGRNRIAS